MGNAPIIFPQRCGVNTIPHNQLINAEENVKEEEEVMVLRNHNTKFY